MRPVRPASPHSELAAQVRAALLDRSFGELRLFGAAAFRPHDQAWTLVSAWARGPALGMVLVPASRDGDAVLLEVVDPEEVAVGTDRLEVARAGRVSFGSRSAEVQPEGVLRRRGDREKLVIGPLAAALILAP